KNGAQVINSGTIKMNDTNGVAIYNPNVKSISNTGEITLSGKNQIGVYYENENISVLNTGGIKIKGEGIIAFDVNAGDFTSGRTDLYVSSVGNKEVKVFGDVLIDSDAKGSMGAFARNSIKKAINTGNITIKGVDSSGLVGLDGTTLQNDGNINVETKESYGIQAVKDATVINNGNVSNTATDGVAIYMGIEDSNLYMDEKSTVIGTVVSSGGVGRFYGKDDFSSSTTHNIDYSLKGFSHMDITSGEFAIKKDTTLKSPIRNTLATGHEDTSSYTGNLEIATDKTLTMEVEVNRNNVDGNKYTSTVHANSLDIQGKLSYKPLDSVYVVADDVDEIVVPNIYTNEEIKVTEDNIEVLNYVSGWEGTYRLSSDKTDLSMVLKRKTGGDNLPDSYKNGVWNYSYNFLDKKYLSEATNLKDKFKVIEKIHNAEIPYYIDAGPIVKSGNYEAGDKKGYFFYDTYGGKLDSYYKIRENIILGLGFTGLESKVKYKYNSSEKLNSYILNFNAAYQIEDFKIGGYVGTSINKHKLERGITGKEYIVNANYESYGFNIGLVGEYKYRVSRDSVIRTHASLGYLFNYIEGYKETGNEYYIMNLPSLRENIPNVKLGTKWEHRNKNRFTELGVNLEYFFNGMIDNRRGYYIFNEKAKYDIYSVKLPRFILSVDLKQEIDINDRLSVYGLISAEMGENFWQALGRVGVTYEF
ncbi:MAG: autotransporter outer membrane beta-barrel domain-containing protein, partial [Fusobacterium sp. JB021]|nr:autotransporter outer membrane beta-barrel domain-containing protein [Fusobacterium sp. JB021]